VKKQITLGQAIGFAITIFLVVLAWVGAIQESINRHDERIKFLESSDTKIEKKIDQIQETTTKILIELQNKKNRD